MQFTAARTVAEEIECLKVEMENLEASKILQFEPKAEQRTPNPLQNKASTIDALET